MVADESHAPVPDVAPFLTTALKHEPIHAVLQNLKLVEKWTGKIQPENTHYDFPVEAADQAYMDGYLREWGIEPRQPIFCIHPGAGTWVMATIPPRIRRRLRRSAA